MLRLALVGLIAATRIIPGGMTGQTNLDCAQAYRIYVEELARKKISPERRAALHRWALRAYDACETGDVKGGVKELFESLERRGY